jgi:hypothetical protein
VVRRTDGAEISAGQKVKENVPAAPKAVAMDLYGAAVATNAPSLAGYTTAVGWPDKSWWNDPKRAIYTYCLVHRIDDTGIKGRLK